MLTDTILPLVAVIVALIAATRAPVQDRSAAVRCAVIFALGWLFFALSWAEHAPARLLWMATGAEVPAERLWAVADVIVGVSILSIAGLRYWGIALFLLFFVQVLFHAGLAWGGIPYPQYRNAIEVTFYLEAACFLFAGSTERVRVALDRHDDRIRRRMALRADRRDRTAGEAERHG